MTGKSTSIMLFKGTVDRLARNHRIGKFEFVWQEETPSAPFALLDFHDQTIRRSGRALLETRGNLVLIDEDGQIFTQPADRSGNFAADLTPGPVREVLERFSALRCLMVICSGSIVERRAALVDDERKTHARASFQTLQTDDGQMTLARIQPIRGYAGACRKLKARISHEQMSLAELYSVVAAGVTPYEAKPKIALTRSESAHDVAGDIIGAYLRVARRNEAGIVADLDTEFLHDYRVALRKARSVVSLFKGIYTEDGTRELKSTLADLMSPTGRLRDLDVYLLDRSFYFDLLPDTLHDGLTVMFDAFSAERAQQHAQLSRRLQGKAYDSGIAALVARFSDECDMPRGPNAGLPAHAYAQQLIWKRYRKVCRIAAGIEPSTPDEEVHDLRINCKKLRYLMEFFAPLFPSREMKPILKPLKRLQDNLGLFNDYSVQQDALQDFMATHATGNRARELSVAKSIGALIAVLHQRQVQERARVMDNFAHFDSDAVRATFRTLFKDNPNGGCET